MKILSISLTALFWLFIQPLSAQHKNSAEIYQDLLQFKSPYRVLYLAAHPDDENTRLISYFANEVRAETAYLSLTRGDGGQNLIGDEKGPLLGVLRTQELLSAREIDGGKQFFTRAVDFGYSKTSEESFEFWNKDKVLSDVCFAIRNFKPHIIVNRFPTDNYNGHGHHHASALLSNEAFELTVKNDVYPNQVEELGVWQVGSLYHNSSTWWDKSLEERARNDASITQINIGKYNELLGYSYNELAAYSRSQHKSQGFGSAPKSGNEYEYLEYLKGNFTPGELLHRGLLDSIDVEWLKFGQEIDKLIAKFNFTETSDNVSGLLEIREKALKLDSLHGRFARKVQQLDQIIMDCLGLNVELISKKEAVTPNGQLTIDLKALNRSTVPVTLKEIDIDGNSYSWNRVFSDNTFLEDTIRLELQGLEYSTPYWLRNEFKAFFNHNQELLRNPEGQGFGGTVKISIDGQELSFFAPVIYKWTDRVRGGLSKKLEILPSIGLNFDQSIYLPKDSLVSGNIILRSYSENELEGQLIIRCKGRTFSYDKRHVIKGGSVISVPFTTIINGEANDDNVIEALFISESDTFRHQVLHINYDHIDPQVVLMPGTSRLIPVKLIGSPGRIAYVEGPDNEMIRHLKNWGIEIETITEEDLLAGKLTDFDVLLFGIRSINVNPSWNKHAELVQDFIRQGGLVIVQYQTSRGINPITLSPYSFEVSRNRVTNENASANWVHPDHRLLNTPFKLERGDFENWNQERGLYFGDNWDENFRTVISWHDKGELDQFGGLLVGDFHKGAFIYTGISFFRHIPYGVPGSYKLLLNILSYEP